MPPSLLHILHLMREARSSAHEEGLALTLPFKPTDVAAVHTCSHKHGHGIYFRLKDGRVFSASAAELDPNPACYDTSDPSPGSLLPVAFSWRPTRSG